MIPKGFVSTQVENHWSRRWNPRGRLVGRDVEKVLFKGLKFIAGRGMDGGVETCTSAPTKEAQGPLPSVSGSSLR